MGNYAAIMSHLTTSSIYETLAWVALLWKLLSCRRSKQHSQEMRGCDKISDDFTTSFSWFSVNSQALITQPFLMQFHENVCKIFCQHFFLEFHLKRWKCFLKIILRKSENNVKIFITIYCFGIEVLKILWSVYRFDLWISILYLSWFNMSSSKNWNVFTWILTLSV